MDVGCGTWLVPRDSIGEILEPLPLAHLACPFPMQRQKLDRNLNSIWSCLIELGGGIWRATVSPRNGANQGSAQMQLGRGPAPGRGCQPGLQLFLTLLVAKLIFWPGFNVLSNISSPSSSTFVIEHPRFCPIRTSIDSSLAHLIASFFYFLEKYKHSSNQRKKIKSMIS